MTDKFEEKLFGGLCKKAKPSKELHDRVMDLYPTEQAKDNKVVKSRRALKPIIVCVLMVTILFGGTSAYANIKGVTISDLFRNIWGMNDDEIVALEQGEYSIVSESCKSRNFNVSFYDCISGEGAMHIILKVEGKDGYELPKDLMIENAHIKFENESVGAGFTKDYYLLKKENGVNYYSIMILANPKAMKENSIELSDIHFIRGKVAKDGSLYEVGKLIELVGYKLKLKLNVNESNVVIKAGESEFKITSLGVYTDGKGWEWLAKESYDPNKMEAIEDNACVVLDDGEKVYIQLTDSTEQLGKGYLYKPINIKRVAGIKIGDKIYYK